MKRVYWYLGWEEDELAPHTGECRDRDSRQRRRTKVSKVSKEDGGWPATRSGPMAPDQEAPHSLLACHQGKP